jgi:hypothetical protein
MAIVGRSALTVLGADPSASIAGGRVTTMPTTAEDTLATTDAI